MSILNKKELLKLIQSGKGFTMDDIANEFKVILKEVIEEASNQELNDHLGYEKNEISSNPNSRNGYGTKTLKTNYGEIVVDIPRDRDGSFNPKLVKKREVILNGTDDMIISLYAKGLSTSDIKSHLENLYGYELSEQTISNITNAVYEKAKIWQNRALESIYTIVFIDATVLKVRIDNTVKNIAAYLILGVKLDGTKEVLGIYISKDSESSIYWLDIFNEIKNRGVSDILIICTDNLSGISKAINGSFPKAVVQKCVVHQIRNSLKYVSYKDRKKLANELKAIYEADTIEIATANLAEFKEKHQADFPNIAKSWEANWDELSTYFRYSKPIRKLIYTTNPIESLNSSIKKRVKNKGSFPTIESAYKSLFLAVSEIQTKWNSSKIRDWDKIYPQLTIYFSEILEKYE